MKKTLFFTSTPSLSLSLSVSLFEEEKERARRSKTRSFFLGGRRLVEEAISSLTEPIPPTWINREEKRTPGNKLLSSRWQTKPRPEIPLGRVYTPRQIMHVNIVKISGNERESKENGSSRCIEPTGKN